VWAGLVFGWLLANWDQRRCTGSDSALEACWRWCAIQIHICFYWAEPASNGSWARFVFWRGQCVSVESLVQYRRQRSPAESTGRPTSQHSLAQLVHRTELDVGPERCCRWRRRWRQRWLVPACRHDWRRVVAWLWLLVANIHRRLPQPQLR